MKKYWIEYGDLATLLFMMLVFTFLALLSYNAVFWFGFGASVIAGFAFMIMAMVETYFIVTYDPNEDEYHDFY